MSSSLITITSAQQACEAVRGASAVRITGAGTKPGLLRGESTEITTFDMRGLSGLIEYEPSEFVFTAHAGTPLSEIVSAVDAAGQYLPFDPLMVAQGSTLGGCIASGLSGPGRLRYGGVRDFIIGLKFVDGTGTLIKGGGKVVKNAAGFDFPKLFIGSLGRFGVITEASFKVFPKPQATLCAATRCSSVSDAVTQLVAIAEQPYDLDALELMGDGQLMLRLAGQEVSLLPRLDVIRAKTGLSWDVVPALPAITARIRVPITPRRIVDLVKLCPDAHVSVAGQVAWVNDVPDLAAWLTNEGLSALHLDRAPALIGRAPDSTFTALVKQALDAQNKFGDLLS